MNLRLYVPKANVDHTISRHHTKNLCKCLMLTLPSNSSPHYILLIICRCLMLTLPTQVVCIFPSWEEQMWMTFTWTPIKAYFSLMSTSSRGPRNSMRYWSMCRMTGARAILTRLKSRYIPAYKHFDHYTLL